jgi:hypothetical protein
MSRHDDYSLSLVQLIIAEHYPLSAQDEVVEVYQTSDELLIE